jgi:hypothetical protein
MRKKTPRDDEILEPLAVWNDGVAVEPAMSSHGPSIDRAFVRDCVDAARDVLAERGEARTQPPWVAIEQLPIARTARPQSTFSRMIPVRPSQLGSLPEWWRRNTSRDSVRVTRRLSLGQPRLVNCGVWRTEGRLRSPWLLRAIPIDLLLWPYLDSWTKLVLEPQRPTHVGRRYFRRGHEVLDTLSTRLMNELEPRPGAA